MFTTSTNENPVDQELAGNWLNQINCKREWELYQYSVNLSKLNLVKQGDEH